MINTTKSDASPVVRPHHIVFDAFDRSVPYSDESAHYNFVGARISHDFENDLSVAAPSIEKSITFGLMASGRSSLYDDDQTRPHRNSEDYFEWIDLLTSIERAQGTYTMIEIGAGYGRWISNASSAIKRLKVPKTLKKRFVALEANNGRFALLLRNCAENRIPPSEVELRREACTADGSPVLMKCNDDYGTEVIKNDAVLNSAPFKSSQFAMAKDGAGKTFKIEKVPAVRLSQILTQTVDFLDMDIQGAELDVLKASMGVLTQQVKLVHIATHSLLVDATLAHLFHLHNWRPRFLFPFGQDSATQFGRFHFLDGIQSWENPEFIADPGRRGPPAVYG